MRYPRVPGRPPHGPAFAVDDHGCVVATSPEACALFGAIEGRSVASLGLTGWVQLIDALWAEGEYEAALMTVDGTRRRFLLEAKGAWVIVRPARPGLEARALELL